MNFKKRNEKIMQLHHQGFSAKEILLKIPDVCVNIQGQPLKLRGVQKIITREKSKVENKNKVENKKLVSLEERNKKILQLHYQGFSAKAILLKIPEICINADSNPLTLRGLQQVIQNNKKISGYDDNFVVDMYDFEPVKKSNLSIEDQLSQNLKIQDEDDFLAACGYKKTKAITKAKQLTTVKNDGLFYVCEYELDDKRHFLKYGISSNGNFEKRKSHFIRQNRKKGHLKSTKAKVLKLIDFNTYEEAMDFELQFKHKFKNNMLSKKQLPDGYTETIPISLKEKFMMFLKEALL